MTIDQLRRHQTLCADFGTTPAPLAITPNAASVDGPLHEHRWRQRRRQQLGRDPDRRRCQRQRTRRCLDVAVREPAEDRRPMYMAVPSSNSVSNLELQGDLWYPSTRPARRRRRRRSRGMTIAPVPPRTKICTTMTWQEIVPTIFLPAKPASVEPGGPRRPRARLPRSSSRARTPRRRSSPPRTTSSAATTTSSSTASFDDQAGDGHRREHRPDAR